MARYELSLSKDYVAHWTIVEAVREIFQNAVDQETVHGDNPMFCRFNATPGSTVTQLYIGNKDSVLDAKSLLLGVSSKRDRRDTIGQFGEGYKLALLVLCRLGKPVSIFNYGKREIWKPRLTESAKYEGEKILTVEINNKYFWQSVPDNNLVFEIGGITPVERLALEQAILMLGEKNRALSAYDIQPFGRILRDPDMKGKIFVNGLYICTKEDFHYGYDFKPEHMRLDRDRRLVEDFNLKWLTSQMWVQSKLSEIAELAKARSPEVEYIENISYRAEPSPQICDNTYAAFKAEYGSKAYPVTSQRELEDTLRRFGGTEHVRPIVTTSSHRYLLQSSPLFAAEVKPRFVPKPKAQPAALCEQAYYQLESKLEGEDLALLWQVFYESRDWVVKE